MLKSLNMKDTMLSIHRINQTYFIPTDSTIMRWIAINSFNVHYKTLIIFVLCISTSIIAAAPYDDTFWDDDHQPHQQPVKSKIFGDNSCYTSLCSSDTIRVLKEITDRVQCYDETSPCRCCLRRTLSTKELRELNQEISFQLLPATGKSCKTLDCDDYQVKAIRSLSNPNAECFDYGIQCRCCVNTRLKNEDISSLVKDLKRLKDKSDRNQTPDHFDIGSFDTFSDSHDRFDSPSFELPFFHSNGKSSGNDPSTTSDDRRRSHFSSSDCSQYDCNGPEVKNIKKMPSNIMSCVKIGNTNKCDCCFNNTLSSSDRLKYEFELFSTGRSAAGSDFRPSYNSYGSNRGSSLGSRDQNYQLNGGLCGSYDCSNDFLKLFEGHSRYFFTCSRSSGGQCKCCINLDLRNLDEFLKLPVL